MGFSFPLHPFFAAATLERRLASRMVRRVKRSFGLAAGLLFLTNLITAREATLGLALLAAGSYGLFALWQRFVAAHRGMSLARFPERDEALAAIRWDEEWPRYLDFPLAVIVSGIRHLDHPIAIARAILASGFSTFVATRTGIPRDEFAAVFESAPTRPLPSEHPSTIGALVARAAAHAVRHHHPGVSVADLLRVIAESSDAPAKLLMAHGLILQDLDGLMHWYLVNQEHLRGRSYLERLFASPGIGKAWVYGYTPALDQASHSVESQSEDELHIAAHRHATDELAAALVRERAANAILVGEPGVGKSTVVKGFVERVRRGLSLPALNYRRVLELHMAEVVAPRPGREVGPALLARILQEAERAGNVILVIPDIDLYLVPGLATHLAEELLPFLRSRQIRVIGLTTPAGYAKSMAGEPALASLFEVIRLDEPDQDMMMAILGDAAIAAERKYRATVSYQALKSIYQLSARYLVNQPFPGKAVTLLEETFIAARASRRQEIGRQDVVALLERTLGQAVGGVGVTEHKILLDLEAHLHRRVVDQEEAIRLIADAMRRTRAGVGAPGKPAGTFLFLGPTGVGKTETAKALAEAYFGSEETMIRLDMSEFQNPDALASLIGAPQTRQVGVLTEQIRAHPFSLLLLDEIEKAHRNILNLFLQILDEGRVTDAYGTAVDFTNVIIIATSNAGSELIRERITAGQPYEALKRELLDAILRERIFQPEFVNRFDAVVVYTSLTPAHVRAVARLMLARLGQRLEAEGYRLAWSEELLTWLAEHGYSPIFGGRELRRVIQDRIESPLAKDLLEGRYKKGDTIALTLPVP